MADSSQASLTRYGPFAVVGAGSVLASLDLFVVNLAFTKISASFSMASPQTLSWVLNAYTVAFAALLVPSGRFADRLGRKRVFRVGLAVFTLGSLGAAVAPDVAALIIARALQGGGAALLIPTSLALLLAAYPPGRHKEMVSVWAAMGSVAAAAGPVLGGVLTHLSWRSIFLANLALGLPALVGSATLTETTRPRAKAPDMVGSVLLALGIAALVTPLSYVSDGGLTNGRSAALVAFAVAAAVWFVRRCRTQSEPAVDLTVFGSRSFNVAAVGMCGFYIAFAVMLLGGSLFLIHVWRWSTLVAGAAFSLGPATAVVTALLAGKTSLSPDRLAGLGGLFFACAGVLWAFLLGSSGGAYPVFFAGMVLTGAGAGIAQTGFLAAGASGLAADDYATGIGVLNTARQIGAAVGVALVIGLIGNGANNSSYRLAWAVMTAAGFLAALASILLRGTRGANDANDPLTAPRPPIPLAASPSAGARSSSL